MTTVKPLEWEYVARPIMTYTAYWSDGDVAYYIDQSFGSDSFYFRTIRWPEETIYDGDDLLSAQEAAQSDYEARILSALVASPPAEAHERGIEAMVRQACIILERACAYAGDAIPASILREAQELHAVLSAKETDE